jgi:protein-tyrosine phosphatase
MTKEVFWINEELLGKQIVGTMSCPLGGEDLERQIKSLKEQGVDFIVSLMQEEEQSSLGLGDEAMICEKLGIGFLHFPIQDYGTPEFIDDFIFLVKNLTEKIKEQKKIVLHCQAGIGRASVLAASIMIHVGFNPDHVFEIISKHRKRNVPDRKTQIDFVMSIKDRLKES